MEELLKEISGYLESKLPDIPKSTRDEIATFLVYRFSIHELDAINEANREWRKHFLGKRIDKLRHDIAYDSAYPKNWKGNVDG